MPGGCCCGHKWVYMATVATCQIVVWTRLVGGRMGYHFCAGYIDQSNTHPCEQRSLSKGLEETGRDRCSGSLWRRLVDNKCDLVVYFVVAVCTVVCTQHYCYWTSNKEIGSRYRTGTCSHFDHFDIIFSKGHQKRFTSIK